MYLSVNSFLLIELQAHHRNSAKFTKIVLALVTDKCDNSDYETPFMDIRFGFQDLRESV